MSGIDKLTSSPIIQSAAKKVDTVCENLGGQVSSIYGNQAGKDSFISKTLKTLEPTGANNSFTTMAALMIGTVIVPRVLTAAKRNPDDKEATKDEITEILFRDVQTVAVILFALKIINSLIAAKTTKVTGLPMTNKPYKKLFNTNEKGFKGIKEKAGEFFQNPLGKLKTIKDNFIDTIHPTGGVRALTNDEFIPKYSGYSSLEEITKLIDTIPSQGGDSDKVFNKIMDALIDQQKILLEGTNKKEGLYSFALKSGNTTYDSERIENAEAIRDAFENLKKQGYKEFRKASLEERLDENAKKVLLAFFNDKDNSLVYEAKKMTGVLKTIALAIESLYLGFGLPALNQKRLERKYLDKEPNFKGRIIASEKASDTLIDKTIKPHEIKVFNKFLK